MGIKMVEMTEEVEFNIKFKFEDEEVEKISETIERIKNIFIEYADLEAELEELDPNDEEYKNKKKEYEELDKELDQLETQLLQLLGFNYMNIEYDDNHGPGAQYPTIIIPIYRPVNYLFSIELSRKFSIYVLKSK